MHKLNVGVAVGILLIAGTAWSSPITVSNFSFEDQAFGTSGVAGVNYAAPKGPYAFAESLVPAGVPGWIVASGSSTVGIFEPNSTIATFIPNSGGPVPTGATGVPMGSQVAFLMNGGTIYQDLTPFAGWGTYTLTVDVGRRADAGAGEYSILLMTSTGATLASFTGNTASMDLGTWAQESLSWTGLSVPAGQSLRVEFTSAAEQVAFDNVQVTGAPEVGGPAVFWTMLGVVGFWIYRKKRIVA